MRYFARVTAGAEALAWREIARLEGVQQLATDHRRLDFDYPGQPADLLALRSVDDVYAYVGELRPVDHTRAMLQTIRQGIAWMDFTPALNACRMANSVPENPSFTVTASLLGGRNYTRYEVAEAVHVGLYDTHWAYVENVPDHPPADLDVRVIVEQDWVLIGLRLGALPLHRRPYKTSSLPGSLKAPVAYCLCTFAEVQSGNVLLDPMCGAGTIPIEAEACGAGIVLASDLSAEAVQSTQRNVASAGSSVRVLQADAQHLPLADQSVDRIVSNLPWGKQVADADALPRLYAELVREFERILRPQGRCVLLTDQGELLLPAVETAAHLNVAATQQISLYGSHPTIYALVKA